jgi:predicted RNA binding protein YcfA (HicA-like mRNA interferase family)
MPRGIFNWTYADVVRFLKKHDFVHERTSGSHHTFARRVGDVTWRVTVPFHGRGGAIKPKTFKSIVSQSGIPLDEWLV